MFGMTGMKKPITALKILLVVLCIFSAIVFEYAGKYNYNLTSFVCIGERFLIHELIGPGTIYFKGTDGYDGQFYYYMAGDLLITTDTYKYFDAPAFRYQRIMYPFLAAVFSFGRSEAIPVALILVNMAFILIGTAFIIEMLNEQGMNPWFAIFYSFLSGFPLAILRDLSAPVAMGFMVAALFFYSRRRFLLCALFLSCAILASEMLIAVIPVLLIDSLLLKRDFKAAILTLLPLFPFVAWQCHVFMKIGTVGLRYSHGLGLPFVAMIQHARELLGNQRNCIWEKVYLGLFLTSTIISFVLSVGAIIRARNEVSMGFLGFSVMPFVMSSVIWVEPWAYGRVLLPAAVFLILSFVKSKNMIYLIPLSMHTSMFAVIIRWLDIII